MTTYRLVTDGLHTYLGQFDGELLSNCTFAIDRETVEGVKRMSQSQRAVLMSQYSKSIETDEQAASFCNFAVEGGAR